MTGHDPITGECPDCGRDAVLALDEDGVFLFADQDDSGPLAGLLDGNGFAWVRDVTPGELLAVDECLYRPHEAACPAKAAPVIPITVARSYAGRNSENAKARLA